MAFHPFHKLSINSIAVQSVADQHGRVIYDLFKRNGLTAFDSEFIGLRQRRFHKHACDRLLKLCYGRVLTYFFYHLPADIIKTSVAGDFFIYLSLFFRKQQEFSYDLIGILQQTVLPHAEDVCLRDALLIFCQ